MIQAVDVLKYTTYQEIYSQWIMIEKETDIAFSTAMSEPKVSLNDMMGMDIGGDTNSSNNSRISAPLTPIPIIPTPTTTDTTTKTNKADVVVEVEVPSKTVKKKKIIKKEVMRKHMTRTESPTLITVPCSNDRYSYSTTTTNGELISKILLYRLVYRVDRMYRANGGKKFVKM